MSTSSMKYIFHKICGHCEIYISQKCHNKNKAKFFYNFLRLHLFVCGFQIPNENSLKTVSMVATNYLLSIGMIL